MEWDRRTFLKTASLTACSSVTQAADESGCGLAIGTYGLQSLPLADAIRLVAKTGFDAVEFTVFPGSSGDISTVLKETRARTEIRELLENSGLRVSALMADLKPSEDDDVHLKQLYHIAELIQLAKDLSPSNPPIIQTILGGKNWEVSRNLFRDRLANWNQILADQKGYLSIKPHRGQAMATPAEAKWLFGQLGNPPRLRMVYDYSHYAFNDPPLSISRSVAESLSVANYVAMKDAVIEDGKVKFALVGESNSWDQAEVVRELYQGGYRGDFCCEVSSQIWRNDPLYNAVDGTETCYRNLLAAFERAGVPRSGNL